jgi:hypothetical protein
MGFRPRESEVGLMGVGVTGWQGVGETFVLSPRLPTSDLRLPTRLLGGAVSIQSRFSIEIAMDRWPVDREAGDGIDRPGRDVGRHAIEKLVRVFATQNELAMLFPGESLSNLGIDHRQQIVPETGYVEQRAWLGVKP